MGYMQNAPRRVSSMIVLEQRKKTTKRGGEVKANERDC